MQPSTHAKRHGSRYAAAGTALLAATTLAGLFLGSAPAGAALHRRAPKIAGMFTQSVTDDPKTLDPAHMSLAAEDIIAANIGASLVAVNPQGTVVPWLAKSWAFTNGGKTLTFHLRSGVKFQVSGTPLTAQSFVDTYNRDLNPKTGSPVAKTELTGITKITAPNATTLVLQLSAPNGSILENIADPGYLAPVDPVELKKWGANYGQHPSSVGPYMLQSWVPGQSVTLVRNPAYTWAPSYDKAGAPYLKYLKFDIIPQQTSQVAAFASGQIDDLGVPPQDWNQYAQNPKYTFYSAVSGFTMTLDYNLTEPMFQNPLVREAINLAVNRQSIVSAIFQGHAVAGESPYSPNLFGYDKATANYYPYNLAKAKKLMVKAGYKYNSQGQATKGGKPVVLSLDSMATFPNATGGQLVQAELSALGIQTKITTLELSTEIAQMNAGKYDLAMFGYSWSGADPITLLQILLTNAGGLNVSHFQNAAYTNLLNKYVATTNPAARLALAHQIQVQFVKLSPYTVLAYGVAGTAVNKSFKGITFDNWSESLLLDNATQG